MFFLFSSDIKNPNIRNNRFLQEPITRFLKNATLSLLNHGFIMVSTANAFLKHFSQFICHISPRNSWTNNCVWHLPRSQASQVLGRRRDRSRCIAQWTMGTFSAGANDAGKVGEKNETVHFSPCLSLRETIIAPYALDYQSTRTINLTVSGELTKMKVEF